MRKTATQERREQVKKEFWAEDIAWTGERPETGWFRAPRTIPLVLMLLKDKRISGKADLSGVYLELLARHRDSGVVEMAGPGEHSYAAGYIGARGIRTWLERMKLLEELGFIKSRRSGNQQYKHVLLIHPTVAVKRLQEKGKVPQSWWDTYRQRQIETTEPSFEKLMENHRPAKPASAAPKKGKSTK